MQNGEYANNLPNMASKVALLTIPFLNVLPYPKHLTLQDKRLQQIRKNVSKTE